MSQHIWSFPETDHASRLARALRATGFPCRVRGRVYRAHPYEPWYLELTVRAGDHELTVTDPVAYWERDTGWLVSAYCRSIPRVMSGSIGVPNIIFIGIA